MSDPNRLGGQEEPAVRRLVDALSEPAVIVRDGFVRVANGAARSLLGAAAEGADVRLAFRHPAAVERLMGEADPEGDVELVGLGEVDRRWRMQVRSLGDGSLLVRLTDRSEESAAEQMRVNFVVNASHELRTPLATLVGIAETLHERAAEVDEPTRARFIAIVHDEAQRMKRLVEDLISLSRIEAERFTLPKEQLPLPELVEQARCNLRRTADEAGSAIEIEAEESLPPVGGDRAQLLQMIENLISNAVRYGRPETRVRVALSRAGEMLRLIVADEGPGIPAEHIPRLTERFYRVDASRSRSLGGTGLGLAIVKHIVERHRGRLTIRSVVGEGTSVEVLLPVATQGPS
ncbi:MAG TPA: ATP-binding protein [Allosphingosinicella sp.]|jgi:two-component system phosphate regulon sensor histidine kinase PhoR